VRLWDLASGKVIRTFAGRLVAYAPDGKTLATAEAGTVLLWDVASGKKIRAFEGHPCGVYSVVFAGDGKTLAAAGGNPGGQRLLLWDVASGKEIRAFAEDQWPNSVTFAADGKVLAAAGNDDTVQLWDFATGKGIRAFAGHQGAVKAVAWAPDGKTLASAGADKTVRLWDVASGKEIRKFAGHALAYAPDGKALASVEGTSILIWDARSFFLQRPASARAPRALVACWNDLVNEDTPRSFAAVDALIQAPEQSVPFLRDRVKPIVADAQLLVQLMGNLDSKEFAVRQKASLELERLGELAEPGLRGILDGNPSLEVCQRVEMLLQKIQEQKHLWEGERLRLWRVIQVLEGIGTPQAQALLKTLAGGAPGSRLTQEAKASLERLAKRQAAAP